MKHFESEKKETNKCEHEWVLQDQYESWFNNATRKKEVYAPVKCSKCGKEGWIVYEYRGVFDDNNNLIDE